MTDLVECVGLQAVDGEARRRQGDVVVQLAAGPLDLQHKLLRQAAVIAGQTLDRQRAGAAVVRAAVGRRLWNTWWRRGPAGLSQVTPRQGRSDRV